MFAKLCAKRNKKGFTLAELLIVVAIIGVLVAIAIPAYTAQMEKAREAVDLSDARAASSMAVADYMLSQLKGKKEYTFDMDTEQHSMSVSLDDKGDPDQNGDLKSGQSQKCTSQLLVTVEDGKVTGNNWLSALK